MEAKRRYTVPFLSRHKPSGAQEATVRVVLGEDYVRLHHVPVKFGIDPVDDLRKKGINLNDVPVLALVAPSWVACILLNHGFIVIELENYLAARVSGHYICAGAHTMLLRAIGGIEIEHYKCPISKEKQEAEDGEPNEEVLCCVCGKKTYRSSERRVVSYDGIDYMCEYCAGDAKYDFKTSKE